MNNLSFTPRTSAPGYTNKYYRGVGYTYGGVNGVNSCLVIDTTTGYVMPNCVGYTWGRWYEAYDTRPNLSTGDAGNWYAYTQDGYARGQTARLGSVICFSGGLLGGHVAFVEVVNSDGSISTSNSAYNGTEFWRETDTYDSTTGKYVRPGGLASLYDFQGFIYPPGSIPVWLMKKMIDFNRRKR